MDEQLRTVFKNITGSLPDLDSISPASVPNIDLYMDQITSFMDDELSGCKRYPHEKILTKTMINNYTKNNLIPPPKKKKYSKEHLLLLIFVYYMKDFLSISDIRKILNPMSARFFNNKKGITLPEVYNTIFSLEKKQAENITDDIQRKYKEANKAFPNAEPEDEEYLRTFSLICLLSYDVYIKKQLIERLVDNMNEDGNLCLPESDP